MGKSTINGKFSIVMLNYQRVSLVNIQYQKPIKSPMSDSPKSESLSQDCQYPELCERGSNSIQVFHRLVFALCLPACNCHFRIRPEFHAVAGHSGHGGQGRRSPPKWMSFFSYRSSTKTMEVQVAPQPLLPRPPGPPRPE